VLGHPPIVPRIPNGETGAQRSRSRVRPALGRPRHRQDDEVPECEPVPTRRARLETPASPCCRTG